MSSQDNKIFITLNNKEFEMLLLKIIPSGRHTSRAAGGVIAVIESESDIVKTYRWEGGY